MSFDELRQKVLPYTMLSRERLEGLYNACIAVLHIDGGLVECGTYKGGSAAMMALADARGRPLTIFDTFAGMPLPGPNDPQSAQHQVGQCACGMETVVQNLRACGVHAHRLVAGDLRDTLPAETWDWPIAILHIDCDWYESVKACLENLYDHVSPGGIIQIDDYGHWAGARKATDEFFAGRGMDPSFTILDYTGVQHRKPV